MITALLANTFLDILKNEWLGIVASAFILISFLFTKQTLTRLINMIGCILFVIYALFLLEKPSYATAFMNGALFIVHIVFLVKDYLARKKNKQAVVTDDDANDTVQANVTNEEKSEVGGDTKQSKGSK